MVVRGPDEPHDGAPPRPGGGRLGQPRCRQFPACRPIIISPAPGRYRASRRRDALARYGIGLQQLSPIRDRSHHDPEPFRQAAIRHLQRTGLYAESPGGMEFLSETLFRAHVPVPAGVTRGQYNVEVYLFRGGRW